jgi:hypothetical protein
MVGFLHSPRLPPADREAAGFPHAANGTPMTRALATGGPVATSVLFRRVDTHSPSPSTEKAGLRPLSCVRLAFSDFVVKELHSCRVRLDRALEQSHLAPGIGITAARQPARPASGKMTSVSR